MQLLCTLQRRLQCRISYSIPPVNERVERVRKNGGTSGDGQQLPAEIQEHVDKLWLDIVLTPKLGFSNLQEMRDAWHKEQLLVREE
jgi:hypothetical protein